MKSTESAKKLAIKKTILKNMKVKTKVQAGCAPTRVQCMPSYG